jgi:probable blue pigment (indigoidine) exporter
MGDLAHVGGPGDARNHSRADMRTAALTLLAPIAWGTNYVTITELLPHDRPLLVAAVRVVPSAMVLLAIGALVSRWRPRGAEWGHLTLLGVCNFGAFFPLLAVAAYRLPGGVAAAASGLQPLLVSGLSRVIAGRRPRPLELAVGSVAACGVALVVVRPGAQFDAVGLLAAICANVAFALGVVLTRRFPAPPNRLAATGWQLLAGSVALVPLTLVAEGAPPALTARNLAGFAYLSLAATALAFVLWFHGVRRLPTAGPPLLGLGVPVTGAVMGWVVLGEALSPVQLVGFAITLGAIAYGAVLPASGPSDRSRGDRADADPASVEEVPLAGEDHGDTEVVGAGDVLLVAHRPAGLDDDRHAGPSRGLDAIGEGEEGVAGACAACGPSGGLGGGELA